MHCLKLVAPWACITTHFDELVVPAESGRGVHELFEVQLHKLKDQVQLLLVMDHIVQPARRVQRMAIVNHIMQPAQCSPCKTGGRFKGLAWICLKQEEEGQRLTHHIARDLTQQLAWLQGSRSY
eukprot:scaffold202599_cov21-Tisochrysis_lutea.AAC.1